MDFEFSESQTALAGLCDEILNADPRWAALSSAGVLDVLVPEAHGGLGLGAIDACVVAQRCGMAAATLPVSNAIATRAAIAALSADGAWPAEPSPMLSDADLCTFMPLGYGGVDPSADLPSVCSTTGRLTGDPLLAPADASRLLVWATVDGATNAVVDLDVGQLGITGRAGDPPGGPFAR
jgi:hypothetical protein